jgi:dolichol-phosphate mannosyltransferase
MNKKISVIMPVFNTQDLDHNVLEVRDELKKISKNYEIILVNDGSTKGWNRELEKVLKIKDKTIKIVSYKKNMGKGFALKRGFLNSSGDIIFFLDSDLDLSPDHIPEFLKYFDKADVVIGSKRHKKSNVKYPLSRRVMSFFYQVMIRTLFSLDIKDSQVGIKAFKRKVLEEVMPKMLVKRYAYDIEMLSVANKLGYKIQEAPIHMDFELGSTIRIKSVFEMIIDTLAIFYRLKIIRHYG